MAWWGTLLTRTVSLLHFCPNRCELRTDPILLRFSCNERVWKSSERVMDCEKLILFKHIFYHCRFDIARKKNENTIRNESHPDISDPHLRNPISRMTHLKWTTSRCYRPQIWEILFLEWPSSLFFFSFFGNNIRELFRNIHNPIINLDGYWVNGW